MNTSSWGPKAWRYLHLTAQYYDQNINDKNESKYKKMFTKLENVLPCIFCRKSYSKFIKELPINTNSLPEWLYHIHNKVNQKLRDQGTLHTRDPKFSQVYRKYQKLLNQVENNNQSLKKEIKNMWYFLYTIAFNYDPDKHNKDKYLEFYQLVPQTLPYTDMYNNIFVQEYSLNPLCMKVFNNRENLILWLYLLNYRINQRLDWPIENFRLLCHKFEKIRAKCSNSKKSAGNMVGTCQIPKTSTRCNKITMKGRQCLRDHINDSKYCYQHCN